MNNFMGFKRKAMFAIYMVPFSLGVWGLFNDPPQENTMAFLNNDTIVYGFLGFGLVGMIGMIVDFFLLYKKLIRNKKRRLKSLGIKVKTNS
ncbi:MAG: hypothetical protein P8N61_07205 [Porticoccaceae bacterium]|nr:hypothetical protein [Porticoccaceae bacterium]